MSFIDTLRKNLTPELFTQVTDQLGDDFDFDLVPRTRLNKVIGQRNELRKQLAGAAQPQGTQPAAQNEDDDEDGGVATPATPAVNVAELEKQWQRKQDEAVKGVKIQYAALDKLKAANAIDPEVLWNAGLIDRSKLDFDATGALVGLDDQIEALKKTKAQLFPAKDGGVPSGTGKNGGVDFKGVSSKADFLKLTVEQQLDFKASHPAMFRQFMQSE